MANTFAPFGFSQYCGVGSAPTYEQVTALIASTNTTAIFKNDAVVPVTGPVTGYITRATAGTAPLAGIFQGCKYISVSQKRTVWGNYWPGSDANGDVEAYIVNDPNAVFIAQAGAAVRITQAQVGQNVQLAVGTGNTATGISGMYLNTVGTTANFPFRIVGLVSNPPGSNGSDTTSAANYAIVAFNNVLTRSNGAVTSSS